MSAPAPGGAPSGDSVVRGVLWAVFAVFLFSVMGALVKWSSAGYAITQLAFFRSTFALLPILPLLLADGRASFERPTWLGGIVLRGVIGVAGMVMVFYGVANLPLADSVAISFTVPLWVTALAAPFLGERVGGRGWIAVAAGFLGVMIIAPPTGRSDLVPALVCLAGNGLIGCTLILLRRLGRHHRTAAIVFYHTVALIIGTACLAPLDWRTPEAGDWPFLVALGVLGGSAHLVLTQAYRLAPAPTVAAIDYTAIFWGVLFGYAIWGERPGANLVLGAAVVIASGLYIVRRRQPAPAA
ncbi:MAG: DMT family transporter [Alphaproteobacteria bacterium]|nr:DMT family transporter [Alphaproteobacteria bacterium]